jgi:N-acetylmuramoyl-L-alanine amidase
MGFLDNLFSKKELSPTEKAIEENRKSSSENNWSPTWFGVHENNEELICKIKTFQERYGIAQTGIMDDSTLRRKLTEREANRISFYETYPAVIYCNDKAVNIDWKKVRTFKDKDSFIAPEGTFKRTLKRSPTMFVTHFDVCLSSKSCFDVLKQRKLSVHFLIDNDGTVHQTLDTKHIAWHAAGVNEKSVGVEISNAFYEKFNATYKQMGLDNRPVVSDSVVHGEHLKPHLGFYPVQLQALKALLKALNIGMGLKLQSPKDSKGNPVNTVVNEVANGSYSGVVHHYQVTRNKIDSAGLNLVKLLEEI